MKPRPPFADPRARVTSNTPLSHFDTAHNAFEHDYPAAELLLDGGNGALKPIPAPEVERQVSVQLADLRRSERERERYAVTGHLRERAG